MIFRTSDEGTSILEEIYNAGNHCKKKGKPCMRWMEDIKSVTGLSVNDKSVSERQEKVALISKQHSQEEETDQCLIQEEGSGELLLQECCLLHPQASSGVLEPRQSSSASNIEQLKLKTVIPDK